MDSGNGLWSSRASSDKSSASRSENMDGIESGEMRDYLCQEEGPINLLSQP
jgi:hypothetical protein